MNVLLVEPDIVLGRSYQSALQTAGHAVRTVVTGQQALDAVDSSRPDLIILELQLVSHSGIEFLYELRSYTEWQTIPVIILSLVPPVEFQSGRQQLQHLGIAEYLYKPQISLQQLQRIIAKYSPVTA